MTTAFKPAAITAEMASEVEVHSFVADASDLGWPPGACPRTIETTMGNGLRFQLWIATQEWITLQHQASAVDRVGNPTQGAKDAQAKLAQLEAAGGRLRAIYRQANGCIVLRVYND